MAATLTWKIENMECYAKKDGNSNVVFCVHWRLYGSDTSNGVEHIATRYGFTNLERAPTDPAFIPYESLTEAEVIDWVKGSLGAGGVAEMEESVTNSIAEKITPTVVVPSLPWSS